MFQKTFALTASFIIGIGAVAAAEGGNHQTLDDLVKYGAIVTRAEDGRIVGVDLLGCRTLVDEKLAQKVLELPDVETLRLALNVVSPETVARLADRKTWKELFLQDIPLSDAEYIRLMEGQLNLERLTLRRIGGVSDGGLAALAKLPKLEVLALIEMPVTGKGLTSLGDIRRLRSLDLRKCDALTAADYQALRAMNRLKEVKLSGSAADDSVIAMLAEMPAMESLLIEDSPVTKVGIAKLGATGRLRSLGFTRCYSVSDDALRVASSLPRLETISIRKCPVSGEFLIGWSEALQNQASALKKLVLTDTFISEKGLEILPQLAPRLKQLDLSRDMLSPKAVQHIGKLKELESLRLSKCSLSDSAVEPLAGLHKLRFLDLSGNYGITDASAALLRKLPLGIETNLAATGVVRETPLFDGRTFDGWEGDLNTFRIEDGAIVGGNLERPIDHNEFLCTKKEYSNFELRLQCKLKGKEANGGIQFRSRRVPDNFEVSGYQADMAEPYWGNLYDESRRNTILVELSPAERSEIVRPDDWNEFVIRCEGPRIRISLNGRQIVDYTEPDTSLPQTGVIGLQIHGGPPAEAWYKDISIREFN